MGTTVEYRKLPDQQAVYRLLIYGKAPPEIVPAAVSMNRALAAELVKWAPARRTMHLENCFVKQLEALPDHAVIKDIDVMFNPEYKVDVMKVLISAYKRKPYRLIWPGSYENGRLVYSQDNYPDYRVYEISNYDIVCVV